MIEGHSTPTQIEPETKIAAVPAEAPGLVSAVAVPATPEPVPDSGGGVALSLLPAVPEPVIDPVPFACLFPAEESRDCPSYCKT